jgi:hypothetical protein
MNKYVQLKFGLQINNTDNVSTDLGLLTSERLEADQSWRLLGRSGPGWEDTDASSRRSLISRASNILHYVDRSKNKIQDSDLFTYAKWKGACIDILTLAGNEGADTGCCLTGGDMGAKCTERSTLTNKNNGIMTSFYYKQIPFHFLSGGQIQNKENTQNRQTTIL